jgi:hypothetical protein
VNCKTSYFIYATNKYALFHQIGPLDTNNVTLGSTGLQHADNALSCIDVNKASAS